MPAFPAIPRIASILCAAILLLALLIACAAPASQRTASAKLQDPAWDSLAERTLVVYHDSRIESADVARHYASKRKIPKRNLCPITPPGDSFLSADSFARTVKEPIRKCLDKADSHRILYIVFAYATPYRVDVREQGAIASVDQLITDIWDEVTPLPIPPKPTAANPYYAPHRTRDNVYLPYVPLWQYRADPQAPRIYSVWHLDAANPDLAEGLVDKAIAAEKQGGPTGQGCFDRNRQGIPNSPDSGYDGGDWAIHRAADFVKQAGFPVTLDIHHEEFGTPPAPERCEDAAFYAGWYKLNSYNDAFTWKPGAVGLHLDSMSAHRLRNGPSWATNAVSRGITITGGAIDEPYLNYMTQPDGVFFDLLSGANAGDAFLRNTPLVKWRTINIGDPLYRPFPQGKLAR